MRHLRNRAVASFVATVFLLGSLALMNGSAGALTVHPISGLVYSTFSVPIEGATVDVLRVTDAAVEASTTTNAAGEYDVDVPDGTFVLRFTHPDYVTEFSDDVRSLADASPVTVAGAPVTADPAMLAETTSRIEGDVLDDNGAVEGASVQLFDATSGFAVGSPAFTSSLGRWVINTEPGRYRAYATADNHVPKWYGGDTMDTAHIFEARIEDGLSIGLVSLPINDSTARGAVFGAPVGPIGGASVQLYDAASGAAVGDPVLTNNDGVWTTAVDPGRYRAYITAPNRVPRWHGGTAMTDSTAAEARIGQPADFGPEQLTLADGTLRGGAFNTSNAPLAGASVQLHDAATGQPVGTPILTPANGQWTATVDPGRYVARVSAAGYESRWYGPFVDGGSFDQAIVAEVHPEGIGDFGPTALRRETGRVAGEVRSAGQPLDGAIVNVFDEAGNLVDSQITANGGTYTSAALPAPARYLIRFAKPGHLTRWSSNAPTAESAQPVRLDPDATVFISADLPTGTDPGTTETGTAEIRGRVDVAPFAGLAPGPLENVRVVALEASTLAVAAETVTSTTGDYTLVVGPAGRYFLRYAHPSDDYLMEFFHDARSIMDAPPQPLADGINTINVTLERNLTHIDGHIFGSSPLEATNGPLATGVAHLIDIATGRIETATALSDGMWSAKVRPATYLVHSSDSGGLYLPTWQPDGTTGGNGVLVIGRATEVNSGIGVTLHRNLARVSGEVQRNSPLESIHGPLVGATVHVVDDKTGAMRTATTDSDGRWSLDVLPGTYIVHASDPAGHYLPSWNPDGVGTQLGFNVVARAGQVDSGISYMLQRNLSRLEGGLEGHSPLEGMHGPLPGGAIYVIDVSTGVRRSTSTGAGGLWSIDLPPGRYAVQASAATYVPTWLEGSTTQFGFRVDARMGQSQGGIGFAMPRDLGRLTGTAKTPSADGGFTPLGNIAVVAVDVATGLVAGDTATAANDGSYSLDLPTGSYLVRFSDPAGEHLDAWHVDAPTLVASPPVHSRLSMTTPDVDGILQTSSAAPVVDAGRNQIADEGSPVALAATFTDANGDDTHTATVDWGDGTGAQPVSVGAGNTISDSHTYADDAASPFTVDVCVTDSSSQVGCGSFLVVVSNVAPSLSNAPTMTGGFSPNNTGQFSLGWAPATDPGVNDEITYTLQHKDADDAAFTDIAAGLTDPSYTFGAGNSEAAGTWQYRVVAHDDDGGTSVPSAAGDPVIVDQGAPNAPSLTADRQPEFSPWYRDTVTVTFAGAGDPPLPDTSSGSGVDPASIPLPDTFDTTGQHTSSGWVRDRAGNDSPVASLTVSVDASDPVVGITCPSSPVPIGSSASATWSASDTGSGLVGPDNGSVPLDTSTVGVHHASSPAATDNVGHTAPAATCTYTVAFNFTGFFAPVDNPNVINSVKAGSSVPVKFSLGGFHGYDIFAAGSPTSVKLTSCNGQLIDPIEVTVPAGGSTLQYDAATDQYTYVWKTQKSWSNSCRRLVVKLADTTEHFALFDLK